MATIGFRGIRWACSCIGVLAVVAVAQPVRSGEPAEAEEKQARSSTSGTAAGEVLRSPSEVRDGMIQFSGDLEPIDDALAGQLLGRICPDAREQREDGTWYCSRCPGFTSRAGADEPLVLERMRRGNFFHKKRTEIFATYRGCEEAHAAGGGAVIARRRKGEWRVVYRHPGLNPQQCLVFESDDRPDRLVCRVRSVADGMVIEHIDGTYGDGRVRRLAHSIDNTAKCPDDKFVSSYLSSWKRGEKGESATLTIEKIERARPLSNERKSVCSLSEAGGGWKHQRKIEIVDTLDDEGFDRQEVTKTSVTSEGGAATASKESGESGDEDETKTD